MSGRLPRNEDEFARILRTIRAPVEIGVEMLDLISGAHQQMLRLKAKRIAHRERIDHALGASICMRNVMNQLVLSDLCEPVMRHDSSPTVDPSAVVGHEFGV